MFTQGVRFEVYAQSLKPASVTANGNPLDAATSLADLDACTSCWFHDPANGGRLWIRVPAGEQQVIVK